MILKNRTVLFLGFALALFGLGGKIGQLISEGWGTHKDIIASGLLLFSLAVSSIYLGYRLYFKRA